MKKLIKALLACAPMIFLMAPMAQAQTPDGNTPANEGVCDSLKDGTPGLYGLCVAFCEAQDWDSRLVAMGEGWHPGQRLLKKYNERKTADDPEMPCVTRTSKCPCFNYDECVIAANGDPETIAHCPQISHVGEIFENRDCLSIVEEGDPPHVWGDWCRDSDNLTIPFHDSFDRCFYRQESGWLIETAAVVVVGDAAHPDGLHRCGSSYEFGWTAFSIDEATALQCLQELNEYDGNTYDVDTDSADTFGYDGYSDRITCNLGR